MRVRSVFYSECVGKTQESRRERALRPRIPKPHLYAHYSTYTRAETLPVRGVAVRGVAVRASARVDVARGTRERMNAYEQHLRRTREWRSEPTGFRARLLT